MINDNEIKIAVIGLGYVGLPLAVAFGNKYPTIGYDINRNRVDLLNDHVDLNNEVSTEDFKSSHKLAFTSEVSAIADCNVYIVTVPTPIDSNCSPDLSPMKSASTMISTVLKANNFVVYESTVYPGAVEDECVPLLVAGSNLKFNEDFFVGYSPERINPGDKNRTLADIVKVTSGSTPLAADFIDSLYSKIITAGTYKVSSIKVAEASKVIENTQRDLNIALINELSIIFNKLNLDTHEILSAAATKWNFVHFTPGLVGGHCIGVDPYYLTYKAQSVGYYPEVILAGRRINDNMGKYVASQVIKLMLSKKIHIFDSEILIMGLTFKENCPDIRNTKVTDIIDELKEYGANISIYDPYVDQHKSLSTSKFDAIVVAVAHDHFRDMGIDNVRALGKESHVIYDVKRLFNDIDGSL